MRMILVIALWEITKNDGAAIIGKSKGDFFRLTGMEL